MAKKPKREDEQAEESQPLIDLLAGVDPTEATDKEEPKSDKPIEDEDEVDDPDDVIDVPPPDDDFPDEFAAPDQPLIPEPKLEPPKAPPQPVSIPSDLMAPVENPIDMIGINQILDMFRTSLSEIITNQRSDRDQLDANIKMLGDYIRTAMSSGQRISPIYVDAYTRLLATKTDVNSNASRALDSVSRFLAAIKKNELVVKPGDVGSASESLIDMLKQPAEEDEDLTK